MIRQCHLPAGQLLLLVQGDLAQEDEYLYDLLCT